MIHSLLIALLCASLAALTAVVLNPVIVYLAYKKNILDIPNFRKLQKRPVPVLGGMSVYMAMVIGVFAGQFFYPSHEILVPFVGITVMFYVGLLDDLVGLKPSTRFFFQILVISLFCYEGLQLDNLQGLFGIYQLPPYVAWPLSIFAGVGLINALNMIDGVDGLASSGGVFFCTLSGLFFVRHGDPVYALVAVVFVGALIPFVFCNLFSRKYKMFIGDSGSLILGTLAYLFCCRMLSAPNFYPLDNYLVSVMLTIFAVPVFDTLRVMTVRIIHRKSPFSADKTHLHHIFVALGMPHFIITFIIMTMGVLLVVINYLLSLLCWHPTVHLVVTLLVNCSAVWGVYGILHRIERKRPEVFLHLKARVRLSVAAPVRQYKSFQNFLDNKLMCMRRRKKRP